MGTQQSTDNPNIRFKHGYIDVSVKVCFGRQKVYNSLEFRVVAHDG